jgi:predicted metal-dependent phosphoesterase TrpH
MGVNIISVTDHDTFAGAKRAEVLGGRLGIEVVLGAEFSSFSTNARHGVSILCYMCEHPYRLEGLCLRNSKIRQSAFEEYLPKIMRQYPISPETVSAKARGSSNVFKNHVIQAIMDSGYSSQSYAFLSNKLFGAEGVAKLEERYPEPEEVINFIHEAEGLAVFAGVKECDLDFLLPSLVKHKLDGIEVFSPDINEKLKEKLVDFANKNDLLITGGSNFHGMYSSYPRLIGSGGISRELFKMMEKRKKIISRVGAY